MKNDENVKINLHIPYLLVAQSNVTIKQRQLINEFNILLIMLFYCVEKGEIANDKLLVDVIKEKLNIEDKYFNFILEAIKNIEKMVLFKSLKK